MNEYSSRAMTRACLTLSALAWVSMTLVTHGAMIVTRAEDPAAYTTSLSGTSTITFDGLPNGGLTTDVVWTDGGQQIGVIDQVYTKIYDPFGGAGNPVQADSRYIMQSTRDGVPDTTTIHFDSPMAYFGFWWSAGDASNDVIFRLGDEVVAEFTTADIMAHLPPEYNGNPRNGLNPDEAYAFLNFFGDANTVWDSVTFQNAHGSGSGFESDSWTTRSAPWGSLPGETGPVPGAAILSITGDQVEVIALPEPSTSLCTLLGSLALLRRRRKS